MTIRRGEDWGAPGPLKRDAPVANSDAEVVSAVEAVLLTRGATHELPAAHDRPEVGLLGGDLHRTLGSPRHDETDLRTGRGMRFPIDVVEVVVNHPHGEPSKGWFCAHLIAGQESSRPFESFTYVAMNASFAGDLNLGPRAHPGDGLIDVTEGIIPRSDRRAARRRLPTGTHVPHPDLHTRRVAHDEVTFEREMSLSLDGRRTGRAISLELRCVPDALTVVV